MQQTNDPFCNRRFSESKGAVWFHCAVHGMLLVGARRCTVCQAHVTRGCFSDVLCPRLDFTRCFLDSVQRTGRESTGDSATDDRQPSTIGSLCSVSNGHRRGAQTQTDVDNFKQKRLGGRSIVGTRCWSICRRWERHDAARPGYSARRCANHEIVACLAQRRCQHSW